MVECGSGKGTAKIIRIIEMLKLRHALPNILMFGTGFGSDIGCEKFMDIKCRLNNMRPNCVVLVVTVRAIKLHGGGPSIKPGAPIPHAYLDENFELLTEGVKNMQHHINICKKFGVPVVVAINRYLDSLNWMNFKKNEGNTEMDVSLNFHNPF